MNPTVTCFVLIVLSLMGTALSAPSIKLAVTVVTTVPSAAPSTTVVPISTTPTPPPEPTTTPCGDTLTNCSQYLAECTQPDYQATMYKFCRKTCGMCNL